MTIVHKSAVSKLFPYSKLIACISQIDVGKVYFVEEVFSDYLTDDEVIHGSFRDLREFLSRLTKFYLQIKNKRHESIELVWKN